MLGLLIFLPLGIGLGMIATPTWSQFPYLNKMMGALVAALTFGLAIGARNEEWSYRWLSRPFESSFHFGMTGLSFWLVLLLTVCTFSAIVATNVPREREFVGQLLVLEGTMLGLFLAKTC